MSFILWPLLGKLVAEHEQMIAPWAASSLPNNAGPGINGPGRPGHCLALHMTVCCNAGVLGSGT